MPARKKKRINAAAKAVKEGRLAGMYETQSFIRIKYSSIPFYLFEHILVHEN